LEEGGGNFTPFQWIEGIGNISGFDILWGLLDITGHSELVCFTTNDTTYFFNEANSCDNTTLGINEFSENKVILYPNPISNKSILQLPSDGYADTIRIFDIHGKLIDEVSISSDSILINAMQYRSGIYIFQLFYKSKLH